MKTDFSETKRSRWVLFSIATMTVNSYLTLLMSSSVNPGIVTDLSLLVFIGLTIIGMLKGQDLTDRLKSLGMVVWGVLVGVTSFLFSEFVSFFWRAQEITQLYTFTSSVIFGGWSVWVATLAANFPVQKKRIGQKIFMFFVSGFLGFSLALRFGFKVGIPSLIFIWVTSYTVYDYWEIYKYAEDIPLSINIMKNSVFILVLFIIVGIFASYITVIIISIEISDYYKTLVAITFYALSGKMISSSLLNYDGLNY